MAESRAFWSLELSCRTSSVTVWSWAFAKLAKQAMMPTDAITRSLSTDVSCRDAGNHPIGQVELKWSLN